LTASSVESAEIAVKYVGIGLKNARSIKGIYMVEEQAKVAMVTPTKV
jgi:hypothetical protein